MSFVNAKNGVSKIFSAEILLLVDAVVVFVGALMAVGGAAVYDKDPSTGAAIVSSLGLIIALVCALVSVVGFIMYIMGVNEAKKDEASYWKVFAIIVLNLVCSAVAGLPVMTQYSTYFDAASSLLNICQMIAVIKATNKLLEKRNEIKLAEKGASTINTGTILMVVSSIASALGSVLGAWAVVCSAVLSIVFHVLYLTYLSKAKNCLA